jgi:hypothetical protein
VLVYSQRQMASDYDDVYVFDSLDAPFGVPKQPLEKYRWIMFPRNIGKSHWCVIFVRIEFASITRVVFCDPMQGGYEQNLQQAWKQTCFPILQKWVK